MTAAPDVLINNAGLYPRTPIADTTPAEVRRILDVNVVAPYELSRRAVTAMIAAGVRGRIVNISSGAAVRPGATGSVYAPGSAVSELSGAHIDGMLARIPLGRTSGPADAPAAVLWLASDESAFVTG